MRRYAAATGRSLALGLLALTDMVLAAAVMLMIIFSFTLGLIFLFPPGARMLRRRTALARRLNGRLLGREIGPSYLPPPPPVRRQPDGWYRHDRQLYKTPRVPEWNNRWKWMFGDPATWRDLLWVTLNPLLGAALLLPAITIGYAVATARQGHPVALLLGLMAAAAVAVTPWLLRFYSWWNELLLGPTAKSLLASRIHSLNQAHLETADSQAAELRRIERDLHDGAQARLVAIGMTLGAVEALVETDPAAARALLGKAREASSTALTELRDLVRGIHPPVLSERGLGDAVRALALDSALEVKVTVDLETRPEPPVESAAYFSISELLTNAVRHGGGDRVWIDISSHQKSLRITVTDDGSGGADPARGSGLRGIERRLAAFDGVLAISSPPGGPTIVTVDLPHALAWEDGSDKRAQMPKWKWAIVGLGYGLGWLPLFPQGIVAAIMKIIEHENKSWFYILYLPEPLHWPLIIFNIALGIAMYGAAVLIPIQHSRERWMAEATPRRLWLHR
ncbi:hypothetical protein GCM10010156_36100 [Planobispora rosea]|uniref:histidine kinase n=1 Tax=Planobispora rosea TaxID=35762 RepID=A0A8J3RV13_PLARO|nr:histidine kinase [Planobispora rosea]GGS73938.1 hypothetical protein GCM10010156_36100 [Planobispora rosea]GIH81683.1 hypothetical protein Pro02_00910 [Planobispora rosea]